MSSEFIEDILQAFSRTLTVCDTHCQSSHVLREGPARHGPAWPPCRLQCHRHGRVQPASWPDVRGLRWGLGCSGGRLPHEPDSDKFVWLLPVLERRSVPGDARRAVQLSLAVIWHLPRFHPLQRHDGLFPLLVLPRARIRTRSRLATAQGHWPLQETLTAILEETFIPFLSRVLLYGTCV
jgi:hypothetical protein